MEGSSSGGVISLDASGKVSRTKLSGRQGDALKAQMGLLCGGRGCWGRGGGVGVRVLVWKGWREGLGCDYGRVEGDKDSF